MGTESGTRKDIFFLILFGIIIFTSLGIRAVMLFRGEKELSANVNQSFAVPQNSILNEDENINDLFREYALDNMQNVYATGTMMIMEENSNNVAIFIKATLPDITSKYSYVAWLYGSELQEWKKLGVLKKNIFGFYALRIRLSQKELDYDEMRITLFDNDGKSSGSIILKSALGKFKRN